MAKSDYTFAVGDRVIFKGYGTPPEGGPIFAEGQAIEITRAVEEGEDENGPFERYEAVDPDDATKSDTVYFPDDVEVLAEEAEAEEAPAKTKAKPKAAAKTKAAAKEKAPAKAAAPKAETKAKAAAPAKTKAAAKPAATKAAAPKAAAPAKAKTAAKPATKGKAVAKPVEAAEASDVLVLTADVSSLVENESAVEAARDLLHTVDTTYFNLGGVLSYIMENGAHKPLGYDNFFEFCDKELGQQQSKVYQLMRIYRSFSSLGVDAERFRQIGWTYARAMSTVVTADNLDELMNKAGTMSRDDFEEEIRTSYVNEGKGVANAKVKKTTFKFALHEDQAANAEKVITAIKAELDTEDLNAVFGHLLTFYAQQSEIETTMEDDIAYLEEKWNVELGLIDGEDAA